MDAAATSFDFLPQICIHDDPSPGEVEDIFDALREEDRKEIEAWAVDRSFLTTMMNAATYKWVVFDGSNTIPLFVFGLSQAFPGTYYLVGFGSMHLEPADMKALSRYILKTWLPHVFDTLKARRLMAIVPEQSTHSINWLTRLGMNIEATMPNYVKAGDRFFQLAYTIDDFNRDYPLDHVSVQSTESTASPAADPDQEQR